MEKIHKKTASRTSIRLSELDFTPILIALAVVLITIVILFLWKKRRQFRTSVLLTGLCDSGKTVLFSHLVYGEGKETFTSIKENVGSYKTQKGELKLVDVPGHERLRNKFFDQYKNVAKGIVYVVDSATVQKDIRDVADFLYTILSDKATASVPVMILCNKLDEPLAKGETVIQTLLEKEMNLLRNTRTSQLNAIHDASVPSDFAFLGRNDKDFEFSQVSQKVKFLGCSVVNQEYDNLLDWLKTV